MRKQYSVREAITPADRDGLIALRTEAYREAGKFTEGDVMRDKFDDHAILVGVYYGDEPVASARMLAPPRTMSTNMTGL